MKEKEAASSRHSVSEAKMVQEIATLRDQLISTQQRLTSLQEETNIKVREMESVLKSTQEVFSNSKIANYYLISIYFSSLFRNRISMPNSYGNLGKSWLRINRSDCFFL